MTSGSSSILVISDSHGNIPALTTALSWVQQNAAGSAGGIPAIAAAVFLGDGTEDLVVASSRAGFTPSWYKVRGNGDITFSVPDTMVLEIPGSETGTSGRKLFLAHGNRHGIDSGGQTIAVAAKAAGAEAALFGHTHVPYCATVNGIFLLNPGSIGRSRSNAGSTFAIVDCPGKGPFSARFFCLVNRGRKTVVEELEHF